MNEEINTQTTERPQGGMNSMMVIGAVIVLAIIGFFVIRSTSEGGQRTPMDGSDTETRLNDAEGGSEALDDPNAVGGDAMMTPEQSAGGNTTGDTAMEQTMEGDTLVVKMEAGAFYYAPNVITVKKGQKVRVDITSVGDSGMMMHDFNIDELDVSMDALPEGESGSVEFVADTVGEFEYYCSVGEHRANGQVGTLIVTE
ncbi:MAG: plastocyanin [Patescibacteria group bacterium]|nr:plastocyanin [Patescibacteria group bacterium]